MRWRSALPDQERAAIPSMEDILFCLVSPAFASNARLETLTCPRASRPMHMTFTTSPSARMSSTLFTCSVIQHYIVPARRIASVLRQQA